MASFQQENAPLVPEAEVYEPVEPRSSRWSHSTRWIVAAVAVTTCILLLVTILSSHSASSSSSSSSSSSLTTSTLSESSSSKHHGHGHGHESPGREESRHHRHGHGSRHGDEGDESDDSSSSSSPSTDDVSSSSSSSSSSPSSSSPSHHHKPNGKPVTLPSTTPCESSPLNSQNCDGPWPGYPYCDAHMNWMLINWNATPQQEAYYRSKGVDGTKCSILLFLHNNGFYCPAPVDVGMDKIRGVNLGGWLVLEPWIKPSLFTQFRPHDQVEDQWKFCQVLGKKEAARQLDLHYSTWLTEKDVAALAAANINHVRIPVGYWIMGDIQEDEPWVDGGLKYLENAMKWFMQYRLHVVLDLHCAPGSQNGFDNSGRKGAIHFADTVTAKSGRVMYPNVERTLRVLANLTEHFSKPEYKQVVVAIELVNEAFISIPIEVVKDFYLRGYQVVRSYNDQLAVIIGDSFRFGAWGDFMFPPHYEHVWIDTHIYQCFDQFRLGMTWSDHLHQTCFINKPEVAVAPLSTMVGEWSLATTDCAKWLNGYGTGARYDGTFQDSSAIGSCDGYDDVNSPVYTKEFKAFLREFAEKQMDAYESGSSAGWFFWNFKTEQAPEWNYLLGIEQGWIPTDHKNRQYKCDAPTHAPTTKAPTETSA